MITNHQLQRAANIRSRYRPAPRSVDYWRGFKDGYHLGRVKADSRLEAEIGHLRRALAMTGDRYTVGDSPAEIWLHHVRYVRADVPRSITDRMIDDFIAGKEPQNDDEISASRRTIIFELIAELARRNAQVAALLDVAEAAKALLGALDLHPTDRAVRDADRLRTALAATAEVRP